MVLGNDNSMLTEEERERGLALALEKNLFISGGSDHEYIIQKRNEKICKKNMI